MLVISLGLMLIGGTLLLAVGLWHKSFNASEPAACPGGKVDLTGRGHIVDSAAEGQKLRITLEKDGGEEVVTIDLCSGEILSSLSIQADPVEGMQENCKETMGYPISF